MRSIGYQRNLQVRREVDVMVAGGGPAGIAAAVTAARMGAKVFLAESLSAFGEIGRASCRERVCQYV